MRSIPRFLSALSAGALLSLLVISPAAAGAPATGTIMLVNGVPGTRYDVCHAGQNVAKDVPYARSTRWTFTPETRYFVRSHAAVECAGQLVVAPIAFHVADADRDFIVTAYAARQNGHLVARFDFWQDTNTIPGPADPLAARIVFANEGIAPVDLWAGSAIAPATPLEPWYRDVMPSESRGPDVFPSGRHPLWVTEVDGSRPFPNARVVNVRAGEITTVILVGTTPWNARLVVLHHVYAVVV